MIVRLTCNLLITWINDGYCEWIFLHKKVGPVVRVRHLVCDLVNSDPGHILSLKHFKFIYRSGLEVKKQSGVKSCSEPIIQEKFHSEISTVGGSNYVHKVADYPFPDNLWELQMVSLISKRTFLQSEYAWCRTRRLQSQNPRLHFSFEAACSRNFKSVRTWWKSDVVTTFKRIITRNRVEDANRKALNDVA